MKIYHIVFVLLAVNLHVTSLRSQHDETVSKLQMQWSLAFPFGGPADRISNHMANNDFGYSYGGFYGIHLYIDGTVVNPAIQNIGVGFNLELSYEIKERHSLGLTYRNFQFASVRGATQVGDLGIYSVDIISKYNGFQFLYLFQMADETRFFLGPVLSSTNSEASGRLAEVQHIDSDDGPSFGLIVGGHFRFYDQKDWFIDFTTEYLLMTYHNFGEVKLSRGEFSSVLPEKRISYGHLGLGISIGIRL